MIKITLKNAQLLEKAKILIDNKVVDKVGISKPTILDVEKGKHILQLKGLSGKSIPIEIDVSDTTLELNYDIDLGKTAREGYFKLMSSNNTNIETNSNITNNRTGNEDYMFCSKCGTKISKESAFCFSCGNKIEKEYQVEKSKIQNPKQETPQAQSPNTEKTNWFGIIGSIISIVIIVVAFWNIYGGNGVDGKYWFSDNSGYVEIKKDVNSIYVYDEYNSLKGITKVRFTGNKTFVYSDGLLEYTGTINGKKLTVKCENDKMGGYEATKK